MPFQQLAEKSSGGFPRTARLDEDTDDVAILIHRTPEILPMSLDGDEDLVQVPCVTETTLSTLQSASIFRSELYAPKSGRFVRDRDAALSEQVFDVSKAHAESVVEPDGVADDFGWESISVVARRVGSHRLSLPGAASI